MKIQVPGNILLLGEYAITLPGGKGIAFAIDRYVTIEIKKSDTLKIVTTQDDRLIRFILEQLQWTEPLEILVDSSEFYDSEGKKLGYGSSAAVTIGVVYGLIKSKRALPLALEIHRAFQGGKGSGYDILTSYYGGMGLFSGGKTPSWSPLTPNFSQTPYLIPAEEKVKTPNAIGAFEKIEKQEKFLRISNHLVNRFAKTQNLALLSKGRVLHHWVHGQMGFKSESPLLEKQKGYKKSLGAGSELGILFSEKENPNFEKVSIAKGMICR